MPSAGPSRLTDDLWLAAHDSVDGRPSIGGWPLGVGLAAGLLAELVHDRCVELWEGELFRTRAALPDDPALRPLLVKMQAESQENRHRWRGHQLRDWLSYLAYEQRAQTLVIDRLSRAGLVRREEHRRLFGTTVRFVPYDSVVAGTPASVITVAVQRGHQLPLRGLVLAGLFLAIGLHHHALATLTPTERAVLARQVGSGLGDMSRELLRAADAAVGEAAMR